MFRKVLYIITLLFISHLSASAQHGYTLTGTIQDAQTKEPLSFATIQLQTADKTWYGALSDQNGRYSFTKLSVGEYTATVSYLGYDKLIKTFSISKNTTLTFQLTSSTMALNEVVITASESKGVTSASKIDRKAMEHLQPTSFTDLLEMLPGRDVKRLDGFHVACFHFVGAVYRNIGKSRLAFADNHVMLSPSVIEFVG